MKCSTHLVDFRAVHHQQLERAFRARADGGVRGCRDPGVALPGARGGVADDRDGVKVQREAEQLRGEAAVGVAEAAHPKF